MKRPDKCLCDLSGYCLNLARKISVNGAVNFGYQCDNCGKFHPVAKGKIDPDELAGAEYYDQSRADAYRAEKQEEWARYNDHLNAERNKARFDWRAKYNAYMQSPAWAALRMRVLTRDAFRCQWCLDAKATCVHHMSYKNLGREHLYELQSLCQPCHDKIHGHSASGEFGRVTASEHSILSV